MTTTLAPLAARAALPLLFATAIAVPLSSTPPGEALGGTDGVESQPAGASFAEVLAWSPKAKFPGYVYPEMADEAYVMAGRAESAVCFSGGGLRSDSPMSLVLPNPPYPDGSVADTLPGSNLVGLNREARLVPQH